MNDSENRPTERTTGSAKAKLLAIAAIGAGACLGGAAIAAALSHLH
jgi:hypothetical protein